jgi:hypothetical protein
MLMTPSIAGEKVKQAKDNPERVECWPYVL